MKQGPRTGNAGNADKRRAFIQQKLERVERAREIQRAISIRGEDTRGHSNDEAINTRLGGKFKTKR